MRTINNTQELNALVESNKPILLDFYADWCGPCQTLLPIVDELTDEYKDNAEIVKINVDKSQELAAQFQVRSIPALFFIKNKEVVNKLQGLQTKKTLSEELNKLI
jgi:thioredoxin